MIEFQEVSFRNFFSYGNRDVTIDLKEAKTTLLTGVSGSGKSSLIIESITFNLFGKPFRSIKKTSVVNTVNNKDCLTTTVFKVGDDTYKVVRGLKPNVFEIHKNGFMINQNPNARDYQAYLEENILKISYKVWCQIVVLGYANNTPFMLLSAGDRRTMVDELLGVEIFQKMQGYAKEDISATKTAIKDIESNISSIGERIALQKANLKKIQEQELEKSDQIKEEIAELKKRVDAKVAEVQSSEDALNAIVPVDLDAISKKLRELDGMYSKGQAIRESIQKTLDYLTKNSVCTSCKQEIGTDHRDKIQEAESVRLLQLDAGLEQLTEKIKSAETGIRDAKAVQAEIAKLTSAISATNREIRLLMESMSKKESELSGLVGTDTALVREIASSIVELADDRKRLDDLRITETSSLKHMVLCQNLLKDDGIKSKIVSIYIPLLNKMVNEFLDEMDFAMKIEFDENFDEKIYARFKDELTYNQLSQGEQARLNLAIILAWRSIAESRNSCKVSVLMVDEILDNTLSAADTDTVMGLLQSLNKDQNIFIVTHHPDRLAPYCSKVLRFEKKGNFSYITDES